MLTAGVERARYCSLTLVAPLLLLAAAAIAVGTKAIPHRANAAAARRIVTV